MEIKLKENIKLCAIKNDENTEILGYEIDKSGNDNYPKMYLRNKNSDGSLEDLVSFFIKIASKEKISPEYLASEINHDSLTKSKYIARKKADNAKTILVKKEPKLKNIIIHEQAINKCLTDVISGKQIKLQHSDYNLDNMYATQDIGKKRKNQEDSVLIIEHPQNKNFKLLAVSDGMGGEDNGEIVSNKVVKELSKWFQNLEEKYYEIPEELKEKFNELLPNMLNGINVSEYAGATLACAIICKNQTLIINIGDSRVYTSTKQKLNQETKDDSLVQKYLDNQLIPNEELMRFHTKNNVITNVIQKGNAQMATPKYTIINNNYDIILAVTDGISDCLSKQELEQLIKVSNPNELTINMVNKAINTDSFIEDEESYEFLMNKQNYIRTIAGGKDNATAAAFIKK